MKRLILFVVMVLLMLGSVGLVSGQDETAEAVATVEAVATLTVTQPDGDVVTVPVVVAPVDDVPDQTVTMPLWLALVGGAAVALGGAAIGGGGVFVILTRWATKLLDDKASVRNAEMLANSAPEWAVKAGYEFARFAQAGGRLLEEVTDKVPFDSKRDERSSSQTAG